MFILQKQKMIFCFRFKLQYSKTYKKPMFFTCFLVDILKNYEKTSSF